METNTIKLIFDPSRPCQTASEHQGRAALTQHVFGRIGNEDVQSFALIGTEKMGKTSFLNYLRQPEVLASHLQESRQYLFVYLDAKTHKLTDEPVFFKTLFGQESFTSLTGLTTIKDLKRLSAWLDSQDKRLVVMIDNFHLIVSNPNFRVPFYEGLRSWFSTQRRVGCVVTSALPLSQMAGAVELSESLFDFFSADSLKPLSWEEAKSLLTGRLPPHLQDREWEVDQVLKGFGICPYPLQEVGRCWVERAKHKQIPRLEDVIEAGYQACLGHYENIYASLKKHQLAVIDGLLDPRQRHFKKPAPVDRTLIERGWISEDGQDILACQMAQFFRTKLGLPESLGIWQKWTIGLTSRRQSQESQEEVTSQDPQPDKSASQSSTESLDESQIQHYRDQLRQIFSEEQKITLVERQRLDSALTDLKLPIQQAVQWENQVRKELGKPELHWQDEYKESCRVLQSQSSSRKEKVEKLRELKATYEDRGRVIPPYAKEIREHEGVENKGHRVALWAGSIVGVVLIMVGVILFKSSPEVKQPSKEKVTEAPQSGHSAPETPSDKTAEKSKEKVTKVPQSGPSAPETPSDKTGEKPTEEKPVETQISKYPAETSTEKPVEIEKQPEPKVTSIQGYDFLVVDLDQADKKKLFLVDSSQAKPTVPLLEGLEASQKHPSMSLDNRWLVFQQGTEEICLINLAQQQRILPCQSGKTPAVAPDGSKVVYVPLDSEKILGIWWLETQQLQTVMFNEQTGMSSPVFLSDNQHIVFKASTGMSQIFLYDSAKEISKLNPKILTSRSMTTLIASPTENRVLGSKDNKVWFSMFNFDSDTPDIQELSIRTSYGRPYFSKDGKPLTPPQWAQRVGISLIEPREVVPLR